MKSTIEETKAKDKYQQSFINRNTSVDIILNSKSNKKVVVAGPGTGKTFLFKKVLKGKKNALTLSFVNSLVDDLSLDLYGLSEVKTLHSFARSELARIQKSEIKIYRDLSTLIRQDYQILNDKDVDFDHLFRTRNEGDKIFKFYESRKNYYGYSGFTDVIYSTVKKYEADRNNIPSYDQILIDEYQDFNQLEVSLIDLLAGKSPILLAGDDDQSLYEHLTNASTDFIRRKYSDAMPDYSAFSLPYCSRCPEVIVSAFNDFISKAQLNGFLKGRIDKTFQYYNDNDKDIISSQFPLISYSKKYQKQLPWFIIQCIEKTAAIIKSKFDILIITPTNPQVKFIAHSLIEKGFRNIDYFEKNKNDNIRFYDAINMLMDKKNDNLGWRIISSILLEPKIFNEILKKSSVDLSKEFYDLLPINFKKDINKIIRSFKSILKGDELDSEKCMEISKILGISHINLITEFVREKFSTLYPFSCEPAIRNLPIKIKTIPSSKGLAADVVILANFDDRFLLNKGQITDQNICNFLVSLTRTRKKAFLISSDINANPIFLRWINKGRIEII